MGCDAGMYFQCTNGLKKDYKSHLDLHVQKAKHLVRCFKDGSGVRWMLVMVIYFI